MENIKMYPELIDVREAHEFHGDMHQVPKIFH